MVFLRAHSRVTNPTYTTLDTTAPAHALCPSGMTVSSAHKPLLPPPIALQLLCNRRHSNCNCPPTARNRPRSRSGHLPSAPLKRGPGHEGTRSRVPYDPALRVITD